MNKFTSILVIAVAAVGLKFANASDMCPRGQFTKDGPSPEEGMHACKIYSCNSCCTANLTESLVLVPLQTVGAWNYSQCGKLTDLCSEYFSYVNCYYQCSPNVYPWIDQITNKLTNIPVCGGFCDDWYTACKGDKTCVRGQGWNKIDAFKRYKDDTGVFRNQCHEDQPCKTYAEVYNDSKTFCNKMWDGMVKYTDDDEKCIIPGNMEHNEEVVLYKEGEDAPFSKCKEVHYTDAGMIIAIVIGVLAGLTLIVGLAIFIIRRKRGKFEKHPKEAAKDSPKELEELHPAALE